MALPERIGLCSDPECAAHFYMPDPEPGDRCPMAHPDEETPKLVIYRREDPTPVSPSRSAG